MSVEAMVDAVLRVKYPALFEGDWRSKPSGPKTQTWMEDMERQAQHVVEAVYTIAKADVLEEAADLLREMRQTFVTADRTSIVSGETALRILVRSLRAGDQRALPRVTTVEEYVERQKDLDAKGDAYWAGVHEVLTKEAAPLIRKAILDPGAFVKRGADYEGNAYGERLDQWQDRAIEAAIKQVGGES